MGKLSITGLGGSAAVYEKRRVASNYKACTRVGADGFHLWVPLNLSADGFHLWVPLDLSAEMCANIVAFLVKV